MTARVEEAFWAGRSVLVTGHTGFKGAWLTLWLDALGATVTGLSLEPPSSPSLHALVGAGESSPVDVRDAGAVAEAVRAAAPSVVFHLAAQPLVRRSYAEPAETWAINVQGTAHVLDAVRSLDGVDAVVVVTSDKCYEPHEGEFGHRETDPLGGRDPYSASKAAAEIVCAAYRASYSLPLATARAGNVIGGGDFGQDRLVPDAMEAALDGRPVDVRNPRAVRPGQHVLNPLAGYLMLAERLVTDPPAEGAFNFGPDDADARPVGAIVARLVELWPGELEQRDGSDPDAPHEAGYLHIDSTRARDQLGWRPEWYLDRALEAVVEWYAAYRDGRDVREVTLAQIRAFSGG